MDAWKPKYKALYDAVEAVCYGAAAMAYIMALVLIFAATI